MFGLMSHAPHLPRCMQLGALSQTLAKDHQPALGGHHTAWAGGLFLHDNQGSITEEIKGQSVNLDKIFKDYLALCLCAD